MTHPRRAPARLRSHRLPARRLEELVEAATLDCHTESEQAGGWFAMIDEHLAVPFETAVLGVPVTVERVELDSNEQIVAVCSRGSRRQVLPLLDLPLPDPAPGGAEWIAAYRH